MEVSWEGHSSGPSAPAFDGVAVSTHQPLKSSKRAFHAAGATPFTRRQPAGHRRADVAGLPAVVDVHLVDGAADIKEAIVVGGVACFGFTTVAGCDDGGGEDGVGALLRRCGGCGAREAMTARQRREVAGATARRCGAGEATTLRRRGEVAGATARRRVARTLLRRAVFRCCRRVGSLRVAFRALRFAVERFVCGGSICGVLDDPIDHRFFGGAERRTCVVLARLVAAADARR